MVVVDLLLGRQPRSRRRWMPCCASSTPATCSAISICVSQVLELGLPTVLAVNMLDVAENRGIRVELDAAGTAVGRSRRAHPSQSPDGPAAPEGRAGETIAHCGAGVPPAPTCRRDACTTTLRRCRRRSRRKSRCWRRNWPAAPATIVPAAAALPGAAAAVGHQRLLAADAVATTPTSIGGADRGGAGPAGRRRLSRARRSKRPPATIGPATCSKAW